MGGHHVAAGDGVFDNHESLWLCRLSMRHQMVSPYFQRPSTTASAAFKVRYPLLEPHKLPRGLFWRERLFVHEGTPRAALATTPQALDRISK